MMNMNDEPIVVTDENFGELLIEGLRQAVEVRRGEHEPAWKTTRAIPTEGDGSRS
ncbi:hypothetical protein [Longimicrobium sp.]|uniref:hypothetical protein n=1 Tax=Longimicrobium sp. TaxID=2029185 RepID=UPI002E353C85|nr:hypothetical protein [Longimicrobium sp.]HEX6042430.1 hypothetical protein [Longimicrobium sp.]